MKRFPLLAFALLVIACGREQNVASKSAAADHDSHGAAAGTATAMDHSAHGTTADPHAGHDMTASGAAVADHSGHGASGTDHAAMGHRTTASGAHAQHGTARGTSGGHAGHTTAARTGGHDQHAGMQHGPTAAGPDPHAQHRQPASATAVDHSQHTATSPAPAAGADPHAHHRAAATPAAPISATPPRTNAEIGAIRPSSTLQPDAFDAPAATSVSEAAKARQGGGHEGHQTRAAAVYTCPMHPEVTSDKPGTCPKCGMALVKKN
jgi:Heavy metal binding domain